jgi:cyclopropane-fatty-acyl-phospholipid synthase
MALVSLEFSRRAYIADFAFYACAAAGLLVLLALAAPRNEWLALSACAIAGVASWTLIEYLVHRFLMHGVNPIRRWHGEHHRRTTALIGSPTLIGGPLVFGLIYLPSWALTNVWYAAAITFGVLSGLVFYTATHHAIHHWSARTKWLQERQRWHTLHHRLGRPVCYGVTSAFWDHVFRSAL